MFTRDTGFLLRNWADLSSEVGKWCSVSMKALHLQQETGQEMGFIFGCSKYFECGASMVDHTRSVSFRISLLSPIYITSNNSVNKAKLSGNFPHWCSTIVSLDTYIYYAFQNWLCKHLWSVLNFCWLFYTYSQAFNHLHPKTSMHNLHIVLYTFPKVLTGRNLFANQKIPTLVTILCILITWVCNSGFILLGEIRCQSLLGLKG